MTRIRRAGAAVCIALVASALAACGSSGGDDPASVADAPAGLEADETARRQTVTFVGAVDGLDASIGLVTRGEQVEVYLCDGTPSQVSLATWMKGSFAGPDLEVASPAATVRATRDGDTIEGTVVVGGVSHAFTAAPGEYPADVWESRVVTPDGLGRIGWIVLDDGTQRGATRVGADVSTTPTLDLLGVQSPVTGASPPLPADLVPFVGPNRNTKAKPPTKAERCASLLESYNWWLDLLGRDGATIEELQEIQSLAEFALEQGRGLGCGWAKPTTS